MAKVDFDGAGWLKGLDAIASPKMKESLARSMAVAGGKVLRDEAKRWVPVESGRLQSSIYLAHRDTRSGESQQVYSVSWNSKTAPHGHLVEFGHWQTNVRYQGSDGQWHTGPALPAPKWVAAKPFLRPAQDVAGDDAIKAMIQRGKERLPELLREAYQPADEDFV